MVLDIAPLNGAQ